jgi:hypothetical protein
VLGRGFVVGVVRLIGRAAAGRASFVLILVDASGAAHDVFLSFVRKGPKEQDQLGLRLGQSGYGMLVPFTCHKPLRINLE